jgi:hypothetical protein
MQNLRIMGAVRPRNEGCWRVRGRCFLWCALGNPAFPCQRYYENLRLMFFPSPFFPSSRSSSAVQHHSGPRGESSTRPFVMRASLASPRLAGVRLREYAGRRCGNPNFAINSASLTVVAIVAHLVAGPRPHTLIGEPARAEPKALRLRLLHAPAGLTWAWGRRHRGSLCANHTIPQPA